MSAPGSLAIRPARPEDADAVTEALVAEEVAVRGRSTWDASDTAEWWRGLELTGEAWVVEAQAGRVAGCLALFTGGGRCSGWGSVAPEFEGRGVGSALVALAEERARTLGASHVQLGSFAENAAAASLFEELGFGVVRRHYRMAIQLVHPRPPEWPPGITAASFDPGDARTVHAALQEALADDWSHNPTPYETWRRMRVEAPDFDPALWTVAWEGDEVAGVIRCDPRRWGGGWVGVLGVRRPWRRRGLGLALLRRAFATFFDRGERRVALGVDAENPSGATRLYERAGMHVEAEHLTWEKEVA